MNDSILANDTWLRYQYIRDNGHLDYILKAKRCEDFFVGLQWSAEDLALLQQYRRPALTINKIISTISTVMGEQIANRFDASFRPRDGDAREDIATALTKVYKHVAYLNQLPWIRSDMFADGIIGSRGFIDMRMDFSNNMKGDIRMMQMNPKNVLVDPDADEYDPDHWGDQIITKWLSPDMVELLYGKEYAEALTGRAESHWPYGYDSIDRERDRFGTPRAVTYGLGTVNYQNNVRNIRVIERQHRRNTMLQHFIDTQTGDTMEIPAAWDRERIALAVQTYGYGVVKKLTPRIRWTVVADEFVMHDDWSPYKHFTIVPYFPFFRRGRTSGIVEHLLGSQELLNKVSSQELHVVNTTANSGWKIVKGSLVNMTTGELEQRGGQTGLVIELDALDHAEKIAPNPTPSGLDRISFKAEDHIKAISGVPDSMQGFDREDVAAKSTQMKAARGRVNLAKPLDNLERTDYILARNFLDLVQEYYTEERTLRVVSDRNTGATELVSINSVQDDGTIENDLTIGEYDVMITSEPDRELLEDSEFDQVLAMHKEGIPIPPTAIVAASRLRGKAEIVKEMQGDQNSPEVQQQKQLALRLQAAEVDKVEAEAMAKKTDAQLKQAKAHKEMINAGKTALEDPNGDAAGGQNTEMYKIEQEYALKKEQMEREFQFKERELEQTMALKREELQQTLALKREEHDMKRQAHEDDRALKEREAFMSTKEQK